MSTYNPILIVNVEIILMHMKILYAFEYSYVLKKYGNSCNSGIWEQFKLMLDVFLVLSTFSRAFAETTVKIIPRNMIISDLKGKIYHQFKQELLTHSS